MSTHNAAEPLLPEDRTEHLARVIEMPTIGAPPLPLITPAPISLLDDEGSMVDTAPSFYQRNSGSLPKSGGGMSDAHRRNLLPRPENTDRDTVGDKLRRFLRR